MVDTEIWLRLMSISSLYGDDMVRIAHWVAKQSHIDAVVLQQTGLTLRQAQRFLSFPRKSIESSLCWLEQPNHHLIPADSEFYPPQLLATTDYPGALFVEGELHALDNAEFELDDLKWVILMVLFNIPGCENAYQQMEELLFEVNEGMLH